MPIIIGQGITAGHGVFIGGGYANASGGNVTTYGSGNTITRVHTFTANGNFTTSERPLDVQILLVGGGGGGGNSDYYDGRYYVGGAGGGGAVYSSTPPGGGSSGIIANANTTYTVTVGTGGAPDTNGGNSGVFGYTALGGGRGGTNVGNARTAGGNGGCGGGAFQSAGPGASGTIGYTIQNSTFGYGLGRDGELGGSQVGPNPLYNGGTGGGAGGDNGQEEDTYFSNPGASPVGYAGGGIGGLIKENGSGNTAGSTPIYLGSGGGSNGFSTGQSGRDGVVVIKYTVTTN
jgi:hypothetical protein